MSEGSTPGPCSWDTVRRGRMKSDRGDGKALAAAGGLQRGIWQLAELVSAEDPRDRGISRHRVTSSEEITGTD